MRENNALPPMTCLIAALAPCAAAFLGVGATLSAAPWDPSADDYSGHRGKTIYVSKLGDDSDGSSWRKAFRTIQAALLAIPDDKGGHQIIVRPDTYLQGT
ncbi:MAG: hypothetical protein JXQ73_03965 [Phycisphaerae bacterium]|nr:hypothetical protein [Phycisphaerae bacterium]